MHTPTPDFRRAERVSCEIPVLLRRRGGTLRCSSADLSRVGARVRIPIEEFNLPLGMPVAELVTEVMRFLGARVILELHYEALGDLVRRTAQPIRLAHVDHGGDYVEIGLQLRMPITDMEAEFLGLSLPPIVDEAATESTGTA